MSDLVEWLRATIQADKADADDIHDVICNSVRYAADGYPCDCGKPADVIADCEAKLAILDDHIELGIEGECARCVTWDEDEEGDLCADPHGYPCRTVLLLAWGYRHRSGYPGPKEKP